MVPRRRPPNPRIQPEIWITDTRTQQQRAQGAVGHEYVVTKVRRRDDGNVVNTSFSFSFDIIDEYIDYAGRNGIDLDDGLMTWMMRQCPATVLEAVRDRDGTQIRDGHRLRYRIALREQDGEEVPQLGCRLHMTRGEIARRRRHAKSYVDKQIRLMKDLGIIVRSGRGWYEFSARLCWRGDLEVRREYLGTQRVEDGYVVVDSGQAVRDSEIAGHGKPAAPARLDHTPQGVEEE